MSISSNSKRFSTSPSQAGTAKPPAFDIHDLKHRVITCLNKLADRDTLALATSELETIAKTLTNDMFSPFLNCLHNTDGSSKSPVRKQCVNLLVFLSHFHGDALSSHVSKMMSTVLRRLRDSDSAVRSACVEAVSAMSSRITKSPFSTILKPLMETLATEQDHNAQIGSALCLAAAIESAPDPEIDVLRKSLLPKLGRLLKNEGFKGKAALLVLIASIIGVGGASTQSILDWLVPCLIGFLGNDDWTVRKAAAEAVAKVTLMEEELAVLYKGSCLNCLESRKFDKVKVVRETMYRTLGMWKEVSGATEDVTDPTKSSNVLADNGLRPRIHKTSVDIGAKTPQQKKKVRTNRSPPSSVSCVTPIRKASSLKQNDKDSSMGISRDMGHKESSERKIETIASISSPRTVCEVLKSEQDVVSGSSIPEIKRVLFDDVSDNRMHRLGASKYESRVVPFCEYGNSDFNTLASCGKEVVSENPQDFEDLTLIREQLLQIENQQSSLLDLLQKFIGSSQSGISSLQSRVQGLEMAVDEISYDLAVSRRRIPLLNSAEDTCCKIPGAEFFSTKLWTRMNRQLSSASTVPTIAAPDLNNRGTNYDLYYRKRFNHRGGFGINPLKNVHCDLKGHLDQLPCGTPKSMVQDARRATTGSTDGLGSIYAGALHQEA